MYNTLPLTMKPNSNKKYKTIVTLIEFWCEAGYETDYPMSNILTSTIAVIYSSIIAVNLTISE